MSVFGGIDIGGTLVKALLLDDSGERIHFFSFEFPKAPSRAESILAIEDRILSEWEGEGVLPDGFCFAIPGIVSPRSGRVLHCPNIPGWKDFDFISSLSRINHEKVIVENDANAGAYGEYASGSGKGLESFVYVSLGTGVGGGVVLDGELYRGAFGRAGEIGHIPLDVDGGECGCGGKGHLEVFSGAIGILRSARKELPGGFGGDMEDLSSMADGGDERAIGIYTEAGKYLGRGFAAIINILDVEAIIIGGGLSRALPYMIGGIREMIDLHTFGVPPGEVHILAGSNREKSGAVGAAHLAMKAFQR